MENRIKAIVDDVTPNRCTVLSIVDDERTAAEVAQDLGLPYERVMWVAPGAHAELHSRAWHLDGEIR